MLLRVVAWLWVWLLCVLVCVMSGCLYVCVVGVRVCFVWCVSGVCVVCVCVVCVVVLLCVFACFVWCLRAGV